MAGKPKDMRGTRYGRLVVLDDVGRKFGGVLWRCKCDCGNTVDVRASALAVGDNVSCGKGGECHHSWKGGKKTGTVSWANARISSSIAKSRNRGHEPITDSAEKVIAVWESAGGKCEICGSNKNLCVDHCHSTGVVRGILCSKCNSMIGLCGDSKDVLQNTMSYLERISTNGVVRKS